MFFFSSKMERVLNRCLRKSGAVELKYSDGVSTHPSQLLQIGRDFIVVRGFSETLREDSLDILIQDAELCLPTRVTHTRRGGDGALLLYCAMPDNFGERRARARYFVYPGGVLSLMVGDRLEPMPLWDIAEQGLTFVNLKHRELEPGFEFNGAHLELGAHREIMDLQVVNRREKLHGMEALELVGCRFLKPSADLAALLEHAGRLDGF